MIAAAVLWYRVHVPRRVMWMVAAVPLATSLVAGTSVLMPITGTELPIRVVTPAIAAALVAGVFLEPSANVVRTCPHPQVRFRLAWSLSVSMSIVLLHTPFAFALQSPPGIVVIRDGLLSLGIVLLSTVLGPAQFAWAAPIAYTGLVAFNGKMLANANLVDTIGVPLARAESIPGWLVTLAVLGAGVAAYAVLGPRERAVIDDV